MTDITDAQRELLTRAAAEPQGALDAPDPKLAKALIKTRLAISLPVEGGASRLIITEAGRAAVADTPPEVSQAEVIAPDVVAASLPAKKLKEDAPSGKLGALVELLKRPGGATLEEMVTATGWQAHSVRGAMSGSLKKGFGFSISSEKTDAVQIYKITTGEKA